MCRLGLKKPLFSFCVACLKGDTGDLSPSVSKWHRSGFFFRKQHFFKPPKICHLRDVPSHQTGQPYVDDPNTACPDTGNPDMDNPCLENRPQLNKDRKNTDSSNTKGSNPILSSSSTGANWTGQGWVHEPELPETHFKEHSATINKPCKSHINRCFQNFQVLLSSCLHYHSHRFRSAGIRG